MIKYRRKLNVVTGDPPAVIRMSQYDTDVILEFELFASDGIFTVEPDTAVMVRGVKPDGNGISIEGSLLSKQNKYTKESTYIARIEVDQQMTAAAGRAQYKLALINAGKELNTGVFVVDVDRAALDKDALPSSSVIREIMDTLDRTDDFLKASRSIAKAKKEIAENAQAAQDAKETALEVAKAAGESLKSAEEVLKAAGDIRKALDELEAAKVAAVSAVEDSKARIAHDVEAALDAVMKDIESKRIAMIGDIDAEKIDLKAVAKVLLDDLSAAKSAAITGIGEEGRKRMDDIIGHEAILAQANTEAMNTANWAMEVAKVTQKTVDDFISAQGNLRGRVDALETKVYGEVKG